MEEQLFGRYNVRRELGRGAFGIVYEVVDSVSGESRALKLFSPRWVQHHLLERFRREFAIVARMPHRRIVKVFDFGGEDGKYFFTMELLNGKTLDETELGDDEKLSVFCDIAEGLAHIHSRGIMHLDLKPANIFVTDNGAKIGDFGLASALSEGMEAASGTAAYIAPELLKGYPPDMRADLYSLGVIAAELFSGENLFEGETAGETVQLQLHLVVDKSDIVSVPSELRELVASLLQKDPQKRPNSAYIIWRTLTKQLGRKDVPSLRARFLPQPVLVGREEILSRAEQILSGISRKLFWRFDGPSGIGYSRILSEIKILSQLAGCHPVLVSPTSPVESLLRQLLLWEFGEPLRRHLPALLWITPKIEKHPAISSVGVIKSPSEPSHDEINAHLLALLEEISQIKPLVIMLEDGISEKSLNWLSSRPQLGKILVVTKTIAPQDGKCQVESTALVPLRENHINEWVRSVLGDVSDAASLVQYILRASGGIPRKIESSIKSLMVGGALSFGEDKWEYTPKKAIPVKSTVSKKLLNSAIRYIAISYEGIPLTVLNDLIGDAETPFVISELLAMGKISEGEKWGYLTYTIPDEDERREILKLDEKRLKELKIKVGAAFSKCEDIPEFQIVGARMLFDAEEYKDSVKMARTAINILRKKFLSDVLFDAYNLVIRGAEKIGDDDLKFRAMKLQAHFLMGIGDLEGAETQYRQILNITRETQNFKNEAATLNDLGVVLLEKKQYKDAVALFRESMEFARQLGDKKLELFTLINISASIGDIQEAASRYWQARSLAQELNNPTAQATIELNLGTILYSQGKYKQALDRLFSAASIAHENEVPNRQGEALLKIASVHRRMGNIDLAKRAISEFEKSFANTAKAFDRCRAKIELYWLQLYTGHVSDPVKLFDEFLPEISSLPQSYYENILENLLPWLILSGTPFSEFSKLPSIPTGELTSILWESLTLFESGQLDTAAEAALNLISSIKFKGEMAELWCAGAHILAGALQPQQAGEKLTELLKNAPDDPFVQGYLWQRVAEIYSEKSPDPEKGQFALGLAKQYFSKIDNRAKLEELERVVDLLRGSRYGGDAALLLEVAKAFTATLETDSLVRIILDRAVEVSGSGRAILLAVEDNEPVVVAARNETGEDVPTDEIAFSSGAVRKAIEQKAPLMVESVPEDEELSARQSVMNLKILMVIAVPLFWRDELLGILYADAELRRSAFSERTVRLLEALGEFAALALHNAQVYGELIAERNALKAQTKERIGAEFIIGDAPSMEDVFRKLEAVAAQDITVLLTGETGTGKDLLAHAIHLEGNRSNGPFIVLNCAAVPETLLEAELFGYEKGAFTGATHRQKGKLELADGGTIFLDEIGDMSPALQAKLLTAIETGQFMRIGGSEDIHTNVRIIAATNKNLEREIEKGNFREDLYYRISTVRINLPPLRERREDIPALAAHFLKMAAEKFGKNVKGFAPDVLFALKNYQWSGNIRQLRNAVDEMVLFAQGEIIGADLLPEYIKPLVQSVGEEQSGQFRLVQSYDEMKKIKQILGSEYEKWMIEKLLEQHKYNVTRAAKTFGIHRTRLHQLITKYGIKKPEK